MFFLQKVFQLRDKTNPDMEKPFLEHLEDLRIMITRVLLTLVISMVACFSLQGVLMDILRKPVEEIWSKHMAETLPEDFDLASWERAKNVLDATVVLDADERGDFLAQFDEETRRLAGAARYLRAADLVPREKRDDYLARAIGDNDELATTIEALRRTGADPSTGEGGELTMMSAFNPTETFMLSMKLAFFAGIVVSFPFLLYFILQFVLPGLHGTERKLLWPSLGVGFGLFILGVLFAYFVVLPRALSFFYEWSLDMGVVNDWRIGWYIGFATQFTLLFGLSFELPVVVMALVKLGLLNYQMMSRSRTYAVLAIVVLAAVITPTGDLLTLSLMAVPMYILYETCIWLAWLDERKQTRRENSEARRRLERFVDKPTHFESGDKSDPSEETEGDIGEPIRDDDEPPESEPPQPRRAPGTFSIDDDSDEHEEDSDDENDPPADRPGR